MPDYTEEQKACIKSLIGPVDVSAGAGSGKTFTLTQRIASALADPASGVDDIDQVCAITFTEKAAAELKGRVRSTLRAKGLFDQALKVDSAWISTIHGMCARILRAQALELGIDPSFAVLVGAEQQALFDASFDLVLKGDSEGPHRYDALSGLYKTEQAGFGSSLKQVVTLLLDASLGLPQGAFGLRRAAAEALSPSALAQQLLESYQWMGAELEQQKPGKLRDEALGSIEQAVPALEAFLRQDCQDFDQLTKTLDSCVILRKFSSKAMKPVSDAYQETHRFVVRTLVMRQSAALLEDALALAEAVRQQFDAVKRQYAVLDNNDLIVLAAQALDNPQIALQYENKFRLIMVDEFQDTDQLQLRLIKHMAGPGMKYLCTVGDAQQSIYGFRGADIAVYRDYQRQLDDPALGAQGASPSKLMLSKNFRSHADVLTFVKTICSQRQVFGEDFLDLSPTYKGEGYRSDEPRIQLAVSVAAVGRGEGCVIGDARMVQARQIADYFARMKGAGHPLSDMVLLLGSTSQAQQYAQAIRDQVGPCVIAGGSLFARAVEVGVVDALLQAIVNPRDTQSLFRALSSEAFALTAEDYLILATDDEEGALGRRGLNRGLTALAYQEKTGTLPQDCSEGLRHAVRLLAKSQKALRFQPVHRVLLGVVRDSGWLLRLEEQGAEGLAQVGNILKAIRLVERLEMEGNLGPASVAAAFGAELASLKEPPGALNAQGQQAVRIMTIHASKGLEFPVVALADFESTGRVGALVTRKVEGVPFVAMKAPFDALAGQDQAKKAFEDFQVEDQASLRLLETADPATAFALLTQDAHEAEAAERQRLFYVGATRAKEALCVFMAFKPDKDGLVAPKEGLAADVCAALFEEGCFPLEGGSVTYGGTQDAWYHVAFAQKGDAVGVEGGEATSVEGDPEAFSPAGQAGDGGVRLCKVPAVEPYVPMPTVLPEKEEMGITSYSSLSSKKTTQAAAMVEALSFLPVSMGMFDGDEWIIDVDDAPHVRKAEDADKATDFGTALHTLAQIAALSGPEVARQRVDTCAQHFGVADTVRLRCALEGWLGSDVCACAFAYDCVCPEVPFAQETDAGVLEGRIDLLCYNCNDKSKALVVDYKTGGDGSESSAALQKKHELQAKCYAQAVLAQGFDQVELVFFRVEHGDAAVYCVNAPG